MVQGLTEMHLTPATGSLMETNTLRMKNTSFTVKTDMTVRQASDSGALVAQGGRFGGWSLEMVRGVHQFTYNFLGLQRFTLKGPAALPPGDHRLEVNFTYDGGGMGMGGELELFVDGASVDTTRLPHTTPWPSLVMRPSTWAPIARPPSPMPSKTDTPPTRGRCTTSG